MPCMLLLAQDKRTCRCKVWRIVVRSSGVLPMCLCATCLYMYLHQQYLPIISLTYQTYFVIVQVHSACTCTDFYIDNLHPVCTTLLHKRVHSRPRESGCLVRIITHAILHTYISQCSKFHPQPHKSLAFFPQFPSVVAVSPSLLAYVCISSEKTSCAQFCHGYYICMVAPSTNLSMYHDRSRSTWLLTNF